MPLETAQRKGFSKVLHDCTLAIWFVVLATGFSLVTQGLAFEELTASRAFQGRMIPGLLLVGLLPHAVVPERRRSSCRPRRGCGEPRERGHELLAATFAIVVVATRCRSPRPSSRCT